MYIILFSGLSYVFDKHLKGTVHLGTQGAVVILTRDTDTYSISIETQVGFSSCYLGVLLMFGG